MYLDVDGVIWPDDSPAVGERAVKSFLIDLGSGLRTKYWLVFSPDVISRLDHIRETYDVELVWASTWCEENRVRKLPPVLRGLFNGRVLDPGILPDSSHDVKLWTQWKADGVATDTARDPLPYSWLDDEAHTYHDLSSITHAVRSLTVAPNPKEGLTAEHLDTLERFHASC